MFELIKGRARDGKLRNIATSCAFAVMLTAATGSIATLSGTGTARADGIYFGGSGVGFSFGTRGYRGYRGGFYYGYAPLGFAGPPFRPYGPPYYCNPYDRRAYPYRSCAYPKRSRVYVAPPRYVAPRRYVAPPRYVGQPQRVPYTKNGLAPFTPQWAAYCSHKFKSFNPNTGTYLAYSGKYRFCR